MAIIKCKMCGGDLVLIEGQSVAECEYCGSKQTVPVADDEKKLIQFERAERLRKNCEFDKAAGIYEAIVADFPEEAEAYWGLVLCKYGIEYVDDPATGKKIPTCHRSSFDSIMEDSDFEQTLENADSVARRVYREEAKQIEEIRKGIIAVSANEQPYDIFICYKETDENGDRTLDSVLAQDIYDALTEKGYRVFFARITLEDKLGQEYEPYIFAALNSAKIMLAVGTDYEYYNAVWVKNEWSRYLKLMTKDKNKHLIPCYKGIDAYDMPREFAKLQAQDLGKVGAMQDLLRGIGKLVSAPPLLVKKEESGWTGELPVLIRGNMALADKDFAQAERFYEEVLNQQPHNAKAYLGLFLLANKCCTLKEFERKFVDYWMEYVDELQNNGKARKQIPQSEKVILWAKQYEVYPTLTQEMIVNLLEFDRGYNAVAAEGEALKNELLASVDRHKYLSKAISFGEPDLVSSVQDTRSAIKSEIEAKISAFQLQENHDQADVAQRYEAFLEEKHGQLEKLYAFKMAFKERQKKQFAEALIQHMERREQKKKIQHLVAEKIAVCIDGTVCSSTDLAEKVSGWENVVAVYDGWYRGYGLCADGRVFEYGANRTSHWNNIVDICSAPLAGLRADGTVVVGADDKERSAIVSGWKNVIALYKGIKEGNDVLSYELLGLCSDGRVLSTSKLEERRKALSQWTDIVELTSYHYTTVGLRRNGTVVIRGEDAEASAIAEKLEDWNNLVSIRFLCSIDDHEIFGLQGDGIVIYLSQSGRDWHKLQASCTDIIDIAACTVMDSVGYSKKQYYCLRSDGAVVDLSGRPYHNMTDVVTLYSSDRIASSGIFAITSDGRIIGDGYEVSRYSYDSNVTIYAQLKKLYANWKLFNHVDSLDEERTQKRQQRIWRKTGVCQHCGGSFKGLFSKKCVNCGKPKDY